MRLKRVRIFGFKTFADRTEFEVSGGFTAVVGPNGCGKSNLVDAILWGLGEGNARQLRAQTGQDVIFAGSHRRKPVGFAEVTLLFDNEDGKLPIEAAEVQITRKITRNGESDYQINRRSCRLRDIHELLADSGLGRSGYSIVGQKEIDTALSASADDRRAWLDEAAGVQRFRSRKQESLRRLSQADQHLERVNDILQEIENQREPLREEAEHAVRFKEIQSLLHEIEVGLLALEISKAVVDLTAIEQQLVDNLALSQKEGALADQLEMASNIAADEIKSLDLQIENLRSVANSAAMKSERADGDIRVAQERLESLNSLEQNLEEEAKQAQDRLEELKNEVATLQKEALEEAKSLDVLREEVSGAGAEAEKLRESLKAVESKLHQERELETLRLKKLAEIAHSEQRLKELERELKGIDRSLPDLEVAVGEAKEQLSLKEAERADADIARKNLQIKSSQSRQENFELQKALAELKSKKASLEGKIQGLEMTIDAHEGLNQGARVVMELVNAGKLTSAFTPVGEAITSDKDYALAIETALGGSVNDLIVSDPEDSRRAISILKENRLGRATFQPIPHMRPVVLNSELLKLLKQPGVVGRAVELVSFDPEYRPVMDSLLGRIVVVESLEVALKHATSSGWSKLVTLEGELVHSAGSVSGGQSNRTSYGMVQRKADLAEFASQLSTLESSIRNGESRISKAQDQANQFEKEISEAAQVILERDTEVQEARKWLQQVTDEEKSTQKQKARLESEVELLHRVQSETLTQTNVSSLESERDHLMKLLAGRSADAEDSEQKLSDAEVRLRQAQLRRDLAEKRYSAAKAHSEDRENRKKTLEPSREKARRDLESATHSKLEAQRTYDVAKVGLDTTTERRTIQLELQRSKLEQAKQARSNQSLIQDKMHQQELNRARQEAKKASTIQRLLEEYGLSEEEAIKKAKHVEVPPDASQVVSRLRRDLKQLGDVNLGAIEAFERLNQRHTELEAQKQDVEESIAQLRTSMSELDKRTRDQFVTTFELVRTEFQKTFITLFGGGEAHLELSQPENQLESGIDIDVTLPGKRKQKLELLSGGERSLCGVAFLFALLAVKPSPLVVLDEVDAPLDGRNVERYVSLLQSYTDRTQFIVITHNPTTIKAAGVWLGITMTEPGVSTLIPAKLPYD